MGANHTRPQYTRKVAIFGLFWHFWAFDPTSQVFFTPVDGLYDWILSFSIQYVCKDVVGTSSLKINFFPYSPPNGPLCTVGHFKGVGGEFVKIKAKCTCWCIFNQILKHLLIWKGDFWECLTSTSPQWTLGVSPFEEQPSKLWGKGTQKE